MSAIGREVYDAYERGLAKGAADERAKCIKALEALRDAPSYLDYRSSVFSEAVAALRSLSPLGLPTTEREQKR